MKIPSIIILFIISLSSCGNNPVTAEKKKRDSIPVEALVMSTEYQFHFTDPLPKGYYMDTISFEDSVSRCQFDFYFPQCSLSGKEKFNQAIIAALHSQADSEIKSVGPFEYDYQIDPYFTMVIGPSNFYCDDKYLSMCFIKDSYGWGGNHHNYSWYTFSYDFENEKAISFHNVFKIHTHRDSVEFAKLIARNCRDDRGKQYGYPDIYLPFDSIDFSIDSLGIRMNPDLSWADGMQSAWLPYDSLKPFLKWKYK